MTGSLPDEHVQQEMSTQTDSPVESLSFEAATSALERIVDQLERGDVPLAEAVRIFERGEALKRHCDSLLRQAEERVEKVRQSADGHAERTTPLDGEADAIPF